MVTHVREHSRHSFRGPCRRIAVNRLRRSCAALRSLGDDCDAPAWRSLAMDFDGSVRPIGAGARRRSPRQEKARLAGKGSRPRSDRASGLGHGASERTPVLRRAVDAEHGAGISHACQPCPGTGVSHVWGLNALLAATTRTIPTNRSLLHAKAVFASGPPL